ncbi:hypothetical protein PtA15_14A193 [Puccinia triticina]|uniref:HNH nuclease domain-containing protein n=1 Tax=Puccinia triticina TaxID=208348 RepID=A0ABY7D159_9BASI|nr:uncharacterized protein PtA15_14A193 [Puccinia triticina]WAQ91311.1 hypothetical protein PtA15_14A193 [Puccinia triticina]
MSIFIHPLSLIPFSPVPRPPSHDEAIGLTPDSIFSWLIFSLGWHHAALPPPVTRMLRKRFESLPFRLRRQLIRSDLLPHRVHPADSFDIDHPIIRTIYRLTAAIRGMAVRSAHRVFKTPSQNSVERYADEHRLWLPESEINWLRMRQDMPQATEGKCIDFPFSMRFTLCHPQDPMAVGPSKSGQMRTMTLDSRANTDLRANRDSESDQFNPNDPKFDGYWSVHFYPYSEREQNRRSNSVSFCRTRNGLDFDLPDSLQRIGRSWIENASWGPNNRVLFQKECADKEIGILLWPSFPDEHHHPTPRIPVYLNDIIQLVEGDRLLIFVGSRRGLGDAVVQINITCQWASQHDIVPRIYADKKYEYPNPCERYPYCVRRPINRPATGLDPLPLQEFARPQSEYSASQVVEDNPRPSRNRRKASGRKTRRAESAEDSADPQSTLESTANNKRKRSQEAPQPEPSEAPPSTLESMGGTKRKRDHSPGLRPSQPADEPPPTQDSTATKRPGSPSQADELASTFASTAPKRKSESPEPGASYPSSKRQRRASTFIHAASSGPADQLSSTSASPTATKHPIPSPHPGPSHPSSTPQCRGPTTLHD